MDTRDQQILNIRPMIDFGEIPQPLEKFQEVLRQVLKFQNDILLLNIKNFLNIKHKGFDNLDYTARKELFYKSLKNDIALKKDLIGMVKGLFTSQELEIYFNNQKEINKRLLEFIYKRIVEQLV
jgi:hypothetical protein